MNTLFFLPVSSSSSLGSIISLVGTSTPLGCPPRGVTLSGEAAAPCDVKKWSKILPQPRRIFVFLNINLTSFLYSNIKKQFQSIFATETQHIILLWLKLAFSWQFWSFFNIIYCLKSRSIGKSVKQCNYSITYYLTNRQLWISKL